MAKYVRKPIVVEASRWFKNGDHPNDACEMLTGSDGKSFLSEGKIVRYFRHPNISGESLCAACGIKMSDHGWLEGLPLTVCPGDWVVTEDGAYRPYKHSAFADQFEPALGFL